MIDLIMRTRRWNEDKLKHAVIESKSIRQVIRNLGLIPAGGNYQQIRKYIALYQLDTTHFTGKGWNKGNKYIFKPKISISEILRQNSDFQSFKLKKRLFLEGLKQESCELCGWSDRSLDGRIPLELDHINGDRHDNRIINLRILCPNCHSLQPTHRGRNKARRASGEIGIHATLKMSSRKG
jgi:hypothetical protein